MNNKILPDVIKVGPYLFSVIEQDTAWSDANGIYGKFVAAELEIHVTTGYAPAVVLDTFLHEMLHAITYALTIHGDEEQCVSAAATGLTGVFVDNPELPGCIKKLVTKIRKGY